MKGKWLWAAIGFTLFTQKELIAQTPPSPGKEPIRILVTGFGPFANLESNPTGNFAQSLGKNYRFHNFLIRGLSLPVAYRSAWPIAQREIQTFKPDYILALGVAQGEGAVRLETVARNHDEGHLDEVGEKQLGPIVEDGAYLYPTHLPLQTVAEALNKADIPVKFSNDAGGFLCNHLFYRIMHLAKNQPGLKAAFVHVPVWPAFDFGDSGSEPPLQKVVELVLKVWVGDPAIQLPKTPIYTTENYVPKVGS